MNLAKSISRVIDDMGRSYKRRKLKGVINYFLYLISAIFRLSFCLAQPIRLEVTIAEGICNFSCKTCFPAPRDHKNKREISFKRFKEIFDSCEYAHRLVLCAWGEPFMVRDIFSMLDYAKTQNCEVGIVTNMSLVNEEISKKLIRSRLDNLFISFDAAEPELFEKIREGSEFKAVVNNIKILNRLKREHRSQNPKLSFVVTAMRENMGEISEIIGLAHQLGVGQVTLNPLKVRGGGLAVERQSLTNFPESTRDMLTVAESRANELGITFFCPDYRRHRNTCYLPWNTLYVSMDGTIPACYSYHAVLGNIFRDGVKEIWNNKDFGSVRSAVKKEKSICYWCEGVVNSRPLKEKESLRA